MTFSLFRGRAIPPTNPRPSLRGSRDPRVTSTGNSHGDTSRAQHQPCFSCPWPGAEPLSKGNRMTLTFLTRASAWVSQGIQMGWRVSPDRRLSTAHGPAPGRGTAHTPSSDRDWGQFSGTCPAHLLPSQTRSWQCAGPEATSLCAGYRDPRCHREAVPALPPLAEALVPARGLPQWPLMSRGQWRSCGLVLHNEGSPQGRLWYRCPP